MVLLWAGSGDQGEWYFFVGAPAGRARSEKGRTAEYPPQIGEGAPRSVDLWSAPSRKNRTTELEDARTGRSTLQEPRFFSLSFIIFSIL